MNYYPEKYHRRSIRLPKYDYTSSGFYFVTICCYQSQCLFDEIVKREWMRSPFFRKEIELDCYIVMPNHFHGIVIINPVRANGSSPLPQSSN